MNFDYKLQPGMKVWDRGLRKDGEPLISIVTPYYNGATYVKQTYNCIINQTFPWFEWIIVNDGSTQKEDIEYIEKLALTDIRIKVVHKENGGISTARNFGAKYAKAKYYLFIDCDDLIEPTYLEYCWWMLEHNKEAAWAYTDSVGFQNQEYMWKVPFDPILLKTYNHLTSCFFVRKECYDTVGGYAEITKHYNEDWYFYLRLVGLGYYPVQSKNDYLNWYRRRDNGVLSIVENMAKNEDDLNKRLIESVAERVIDPHKAIIYPLNSSNFDKPKESDWNTCIFEEHKKIHLLIITAWLELGGVDKFNLDVIGGLDKEKYDVSIITTVANDEEPWQQKFREQTPEVFNLPNFMEPKDYAEFVSYFIKSREIDVVMVTNSYHGYYMMPWLRMLFPNLAIIDYVHMEEWSWRRGGYARTSDALKEISEKTFVCNSETKEVLENIFERKKGNVEVLHIGVDHKRFMRDIIRNGIAYERAKISKERPIVLYVCRLEPQKRPFLMIEIASRVREILDNVAFFVVGDGSLREELEQTVKIKNLENTVFFMGATDDVRPYYQDAKVTLICSIKEGLALTAYESFSMGVPVISADVGGQSDLIDSITGELVECKQDEKNEYFSRNYSKEEIDSYVSALVNYLSNDEKRTKASFECRKRIEEAFSIDKMIEHMDKAIVSILHDDTLCQNRRVLSNLLKQVKSITEDYLCIEMMEQAVEEWRGCKLNPDKEDIFNDGFNSTSDFHNKIDKLYHILSEQEKVLNRHEEVVNRHEEEINKHNTKIDNHWNVQNNLQTQIDQMSRKKVLKKLLKKLLKKFWG